MQKCPELILSEQLVLLPVKDLHRQQGKAVIFCQYNQFPVYGDEDEAYVLNSASNLPKLCKDCY